MGWVLRLVETEVDGSSRSVDVMVIDPSGDLDDIAALGLTLAQGKQLVALVQQEIVTVQSRDHAVRRPLCRSCRTACQVKDYRPRQIATVFGQVVLRLPRFRCAGCGGAEAGHGWPAHCRSTPELDQVRAHLATLVPYRIAASMLEHFLPVEVGITHETLRGCTLKLGKEVRDAAVIQPVVAASAITVSVDSTYIRSCEDGQRHLEVCLGNVETANGARQVFATVTKTDTSIETLIRRSLAEIGKTADAEITAFTDGCPGLRSILVNAGITKPPGLDWFHIAMRLQHAEKTAGSLPGDTSERENARAVIVAEVDGSMSKLGRCSGRNGESRNLIVVGSHSRIPGGEQVAQRAVEGFGSGLQEQVGALLRPLHLLFLGKAPADHEVDR
jgi:hypothetical protein